MSQYQFVKDVEVCLRNHEVYHSKEDVMMQINENEDLIERIKQRLFGMVCGRPCDLFPCDEESGTDPLEKSHEEFVIMMEDPVAGLEALVAHNVDLQYVYENFERSEIG